MGRDMDEYGPKNSTVRLAQHIMQDGRRTDLTKAFNVHAEVEQQSIQKFTTFIRRDPEIRQLVESDRKKGREMIAQRRTHQMPVTQPLDHELPLEQVEPALIRARCSRKEAEDLTVPHQENEWKMTNVRRAVHRTKGLLHEGVQFSVRGLTMQGAVQYLLNEERQGSSNGIEGETFVGLRDPKLLESEQLPFCALPEYDLQPAKRLEGGPGHPSLATGPHQDRPRS